MAHVVVIGSGLAGLSTAVILRDTIGAEHLITLISEKDEVHYPSSNVLVAFGLCERQEISFSAHPTLDRWDIEFIPVAVKKISPLNNQLQLLDNRSLDYDVLVLACGVCPDFNQVVGPGPMGYAQSIYTLDDAENACKKWNELLKNPGPVIIASSPNSGCLSSLYESAFLADAELRRRGIRQLAPITLITPEPVIGHLGIGDNLEIQSMLKLRLEQLNIRYSTGARICHVQREKILIEHDQVGVSEPVQREFEFQYAMVIPSTHGVGPVRELGSPLTNERGLLEVDIHQRSPVVSNIYGVGSCTLPHFSDQPWSIQLGVQYSGYSVERAASVAAKNISSELHHSKPMACSDSDSICLLDAVDTGFAVITLSGNGEQKQTWAKQGAWVHLAKRGLARYVVEKMRNGISGHLYQEYLHKAVGIDPGQ